MKFKELKKKSAEDLKKEVDAGQFDLLRLHAQARIGSVGKDSGKIRNIKRMIARVKTLQSSKTSQSSKIVKK